MDMQELRIGIAGLGGAASLVLPSFSKVPGVALAAAADIRVQAREAFSAAHNLPAYASVEELCAAEDVDAVWIETPNHLHCEHALTAAAHGKHIICAKPLATSLEDCDRMIEAAEENGVQLLQGHSKIFDAPIRTIRDVVASARLGRVTQIHTLLYNNWLQRPRLEDELDPAKGGGIVLRQGPHLVDIATYIAGGSPRSLRAVTGSWDPHFQSPGNFDALLDFGEGVTANLTLNGYGYFDSTELYWGIGGRGAMRQPSIAPKPRSKGPISQEEKYSTPADAETRARRAEGDHPPFFGLTIVSCEKGVIRQSPNGLFLYTEEGRQDINVGPSLGRAAELIELRDALLKGRRVFPDGRWGRATLEACLAINTSSVTGQDVTLTSQAIVPD